jgi:hypothetical protein
MDKFQNWLVVTVLCFWLGSSLVGNKYYGTTFYSDSEGYYLYLPAVFVYGSFENLPIRTTYEYKPFPGTKKIATRFTYGVALMMLPFWAVAHAFRTIILGKIAIEPYAIEYGIAILFGSCLYLTLGLFFLYKTLKLHFLNFRTVQYTLIIILLSTNLLYYAVHAPATSHIYSFFLVSMLLWLLPKFWRIDSSSKTLAKDYSTTLGIGVVIGLLILIRPTHLIFLPFCLFFNVTTFTDLIERIRFVFKNYLKYLLITIICAILWLPQLFYWRYLTGNFIYYSYGELGFPNWLNPRIVSVFLHICNGFLIYSPAMFFALVGLFQTAWLNKLNGRIILIVFSAIAYICASWWCWWFGQSYGYRAFIDFYPLLALGLASYIDKQIKSTNTWVRYANYCFFILCIFVNLRLTTTPFQWHSDPVNFTIDNLRNLLKWAFFVGQPL